MSYLAADGAALVAAAVQAAIRERAPRRTVAAVAAAVTGTLVSATARPCPAATVHKARTLDAQGNAEVVDDPAQLLATLRAVRRAQRQKKKERRRAAKAKAQLDASNQIVVVDAMVDSTAGNADRCARSEGTVVAVSAVSARSSPVEGSGHFRPPDGVDPSGNIDVFTNASDLDSIHTVGRLPLSAGRLEVSPYSVSLSPGEHRNSRVCRGKGKQP